MLNREYILSHTPNQIAEAYDHQEIESQVGSYMGMSLDEIAESIGMADPTEWYDKTAAELIDACENALSAWYDREGLDRPDYSAEDMAIDYTLYAAWQIAG